MKTSKQMLAAVFLSLTFLGGCSMNDKGTTGNDMSNSNVGKDIRNAVEDSGQAVQDSIDNVMDFFTQKNIKYENMQTLDNMEFAAHEGRSFTKMCIRDMYLMKMVIIQLKIESIWQILTF